MTTGSITTPYPKGHQKVDGHKGITFRFNVDGSKTYYVYEDSLRKKGQSPYIRVGSSLQQALVRQAEIRQKKSRGEKTLVASKASFSEVAELWFEQKSDRLAASSRGAYRFALDNVHLPRFRDWKVAAVDADAYAKLVRDLEREGLHAIDPEHKKRPLSPKTIERYMVPLQQVISFAHRRGLIGHNPLTSLTRDDRPKAREQKQMHEWTDTQVEAVLKASKQLAEKPEARADYSPVISLAFESGMRVGELLGLSWADVDLSKSVIHVRKQWTRSGELTSLKTSASARRIPLTAATVAMLRRHKLASKFSGDNDPVFANKAGGRLGHRNVTRRGWEASLALAGLPAMGIHQARHCFVSRALTRGLPPQLVAEIAGHSNVSVTLQTYSHVFSRIDGEAQFRAAMAEGAQA